MSPELQPMAVQYYCHVSPSISRDQIDCTAIGGSSGHVIGTYILHVWYNFNTVLCQFLETGISHIGIV